jgi:pantothenate synthetase
VLDAEPAIALDYAEIVDAETLEPVVSLRGSCLILLAAKLGKTRLIDNALVEQDGDSFNVTI